MPSPNPLPLGEGIVLFSPEPFKPRPFVTQHPFLTYRQLMVLLRLRAEGHLGPPVSGLKARFIAHGRSRR